MSVQNLIADIEVTARQASALSSTVSDALPQDNDVALIVEGLRGALLAKAAFRGKNADVQPGPFLAITFAAAATLIDPVPKILERLSTDTPIGKVVRELDEFLDHIEQKTAHHIDILNLTWKDSRISECLEKLSKTTDRRAKQSALRPLFSTQRERLSPGSRLAWSLLCDRLAVFLIDLRETSSLLTQIHARSVALVAASEHYASDKGSLVPSTATVSFLPREQGVSAVAPPDAGSANTVSAEGRCLMDIKIFISHSSRDSDVVKELLRCIESCVNIPEGTIRCTSIAGYKLPVGADGPQVLREDIKSAAVVLGVLSENSVSSGFVQAELGAAWGLDKITCPILVPPLDFKHLPPVLRDAHAIVLTSAPDVAQLMSDIARYSGFQESANQARKTSAIEALIASIAVKS